MNRKSILYLFISTVLLGCVDQPVTYTDNSDEEIGGIAAAYAARTIYDDNAGMGYPTLDNEEKIEFPAQFNKGDIIYISQLSPTGDPCLYPYNKDALTSKYQGITYDADTEMDNFYVYEYQENPNADWDKGLNFIPYRNDKGNISPLKWSYIRGLGSVGNSFSFYAIYYPNNPKGQTAFRVANWQNQGETKNFKSFVGGNDVMGAYHATSSLYTRMRFRFFHLTSFLHVTLLVPNKKAYPEEEGGGYSGFDTNAFEFNHIAGGNGDANLPGAWIGNPAWVKRQIGSVTQTALRSNYRINWGASRTSDNEPPLVEVINENNGANINNNQQTPCMYQLRNVSDEVFEINVRDFQPNSAIEKDSVRRYEFVGFYVGQNFPSNQPLISVRLLTPGSTGAKTVIPSGQSYTTVENAQFAAYFYYGNTNGQSQVAGGQQPDFTQQGLYQHITLYLPRKGNETVLVRAKILPWNGTYTDMSLVPREDGD